MIRLRKGLDFLGMLALGGSAGVLGELLLDQSHWWSVAISPPAELFLIFQMALLLSVCAFIGARVLQIADVVRTTPVRATITPQSAENLRDIPTLEHPAAVALTPETTPELPHAA